MSTANRKNIDESRLTRVGCDPGLRTISTFLFDTKTWPNEYIKKHHDQLEKQKREDPNWIIKQEFLKREGKESIIKKDSNVLKFKIESGEYYEKVKINESTKHTMIVKKLANIDEIERSIPDNKTLNVTEYEEYIKSVLGKVKDLRKFQFKSNNRKWRFTSYCAKSAFYDKLALKFKNCRIGYGNLSGKFGNSLRGKRNVPIEDVKTNLRRRNVMVNDVDEYRTSKICHNCYAQKPSVISVLDAYDYINHTKVFPDPTKNLSLTAKTPFSVTRGCYKCGTIINRDVNAAQNMTKLMDERGQVFQRQKKS